MAETLQSESPVVYFNGRVLPASEALLPIDDHGLLYGVGFYETFRTSGGCPHQWAYHQRRLAHACATFGIQLPATFLAADEPHLRKVVSELLALNGTTTDAVFRYTITAGPAGDPSAGGGVYSRATELLTLRSLPPVLSADGICLHVLELSRDSGEWLPRPKSLNCANAMLGAAELRRRTVSPLDEGLFLTRDDRFVVETTRQNIAWIRDGRFCYVEPSLGPIAGTCLDWVLDLGVPARSCRARLEDILKADAVVVLNSVRGLTPVNEIRDRDNTVLAASLPSQLDPLVVSLRHQWTEALETTARLAD